MLHASARLRLRRMKRISAPRQGLALLYRLPATRLAVQVKRPKRRQLLLAMVLRPRRHAPPRRRRC